MGLFHHRASRLFVALQAAVVEHRAAIRRRGGRAEGRDDTPPEVLLRDDVLHAPQVRLRESKK